MALFLVMPMLVAGASFEVASIKQNHSTEFRRVGMKFLPGGRLEVQNLPLQVLIAYAYNFPFNQSARLGGGPDWIRSDRYDIDAKAEAGAFPTGMPTSAQLDTMRELLQALLADRFKLALRRETKEQSVYVLVVAKNGPKLKKAKIEEKDCIDAAPGDGPSCHGFMGGQGRGIHSPAADIDDLARALENFTDRPVVNKTGIQGLYQFDTTGWLPLRAKGEAPAGAKAEDGSALDAQPSLFDVLAGLGLKLESQKAPVESFIITHVERPSEN